MVLTSPGSRGSKEDWVVVKRNVKADLKNQLHQASGFTVTRELGTYLGMPILNKHLAKNDLEPSLTSLIPKLEVGGVIALALQGGSLSLVFFARLHDGHCPYLGFCL
ncbi:hypothetical protein V2J09_017199 [Rumex salicifolius]